MDFINSSNAIPIAPPGNGFQGCSPGTEGTYIDAKWLNGVNYELMNFIQSIGVVPELFDETTPSSYQQLVRALRRHISDRGVGVWNSDFGSQYNGGDWTVGTDAKFYKLKIGGDGSVNPTTPGQTEWEGGFEFSGVAGNQLSLNDFNGLEWKYISGSEFQITAGRCRDVGDMIDMELASTMNKNLDPWAPGDGNGSVAAGVTLGNWNYVFLVTNGTSIVDLAVDSDPLGSNILADPLIGGAGLDKIRLLRPFRWISFGGIFEGYWIGDRWFYQYPRSVANIASPPALSELSVNCGAPPRVPGVMAPIAVMMSQIESIGTVVEIALFFRSEVGDYTAIDDRYSHQNIRGSSNQSNLEFEIASGSLSQIFFQFSQTNAQLNHHIQASGYWHHRGFVE